jgi:hypothetical protein
VLTNQETVRSQAICAAFDGRRLDLIGKYEVHLHRSMCRVLTLLASLQEWRKTVPGEVILFGKSEATQTGSLTCASPYRDKR